MVKKRSKTRRSAQSAQKAEKESPFESNARNFGAGCHVRPQTWKLGRMIKWPKYIRIQRQEQVLKKRLKVPPAVNLFSQTLDKNNTGELLKFLNNLKPMTRLEKKERRKAMAAAGTTEAEYRPQVKFGLNHVTTLVEKKEAQLVVIAHDVAPLEIIMWLPTLCYKMGVPFCIVKGKARLGKIVGMKTATCVAVTKTRPEHGAKLEQLQDMCRTAFNEKFTTMQRTRGVAVPGTKTKHRLEAKQVL